MKGSSHESLKTALFLMRWLERPLAWCSRTLAPAAMLYGRELVYQNIVHRDLKRLGIDQPLYAVGGAANYSYIYLLLRACIELPVRNVLELGVGQSTLLLDALSKRRGFSVTGLEHDAGWARRIDQQCEQVRVLQAPLVRRRICGIEAEAYDVPDLCGEFDLVLVDGPRGRRRYSRWGALEWVGERLAEDFLVIFDDAERRGELDTIEAALKQLDRIGRTYVTGRVRGAKSQFLIAGGSMQPAAYF